MFHVAFSVNLVLYLTQGKGTMPYSESYSCFRTFECLDSFQLVASVVSCACFT